MGLATPAAEPCGELRGAVQSTHLRVVSPKSREVGRSHTDSRKSRPRAAGVEVTSGASQTALKQREEEVGRSRSGKAQGTWAGSWQQVTGLVTWKTG